MRPFSSRRTIVASFALAIGLAGCASGSGGGEGGDAAAAASGGANRIVLTELADIQQMDAYQAIQRLRANWLRSRSGSDPAVYVDGARRMGGLDDLRSIRVGDVEEMRYLNSADATNRFGTGNDGGAILIITKR